MRRSSWTSKLVLGLLLVGLARAQSGGDDAGEDKGLTRKSLTEMASEPRVALVVGNGAYQHVSPLAAPPKDAEAMKEHLSALGFQVVPCQDASKREIPCQDLTFEQMGIALRTFGAKLQEGGVGLFYYSGHGLQSDGENWLVPVDAELDGPNNVRYRTLAVGEVLGVMEQAKTRMNIVILDACRNNPFKGFSKSAQGGLVGAEAPEGTLLAYATAPGKVARDGAKGALSPYTEALLRHLGTPGIPVESLLKTVRAELIPKGQTPWESSSIVGDFYFALPDLSAAEATPAGSALQARLTVMAKQEAAKRQASADFALVRGLVDEGGDAGKQALTAFLEEYRGYAVEVEGVLHSVEIAEVADAERMLSAYGRTSRRPTTRTTQDAPSASKTAGDLLLSAEPAAVEVADPDLVQISVNRAGRRPSRAAPQATSSSWRMILDEQGPRQEGDLVLRTTTGALEISSDMLARESFVLWSSPTQLWPDVALITALDVAHPETDFGAVAIPILGYTRIPVRSTPNAQVILRVDDHEYGPIKASSAGDASIPILVPPGVFGATLITIADGVRTEKTIDLGLPVRPRLALVPLAISSDGLGNQILRVRVFVVRLTGAKDIRAKPRITLELEDGERSETIATHLGDGLYEALFTIPPTTAGRLSVTAALDGEGPVQSTSATLDLEP